MNNDEFAKVIKGDIDTITSQNGIEGYELAMQDNTYVLFDIDGNIYNLTNTNKYVKSLLRELSNII